MCLSVFVGLYTTFGWGHWGYSVIGDHDLDLTDALRVSQGDVPYRDFLPTYGLLHMLLAAPLFHLGRAFFPAYWGITALLITVQLFVLARLGRRFLPGIWVAILLGFALTAMAFAPTNSKFILGYSQSGFLGSLLFTVALTLLAVVSPRRWALAGLCLGLIPFTKLDLGFASLAVVLVMGILWSRAARGAALSLVAYFIATWLALALFAWAWAGRLDLLLGSTIETFGQVGLFADATLALRIKLLAFLGLLFAALFHFPPLRPLLRRAERRVRPWIPFLLPAAVAIDVARTALFGPLHRLVVLNWTWTLALILVGSRLLVAVMRARSLRPLRAARSPILVPILLITGMAILRVLGSGWYPLNYFQPAPLLLLAYWLTPPAVTRTVHVWRLLPFLALAVAAQAVASAEACLPNPCALTWFPTPHGKIGFTFRSDLIRADERLLTAMAPRHPGQVLLCTYEPSFHLLTGMRFAGFYTFFTRLGLTGAYAAERERQTLDLLERRPPDFVLWDREVGRVHRRFGVDYGLEIAAWIRARYEVTASEGGSTLYRRREP
jgi:hypothetical protein